MPDQMSEISLCLPTNVVAKLKKRQTRFNAAITAVVNEILEDEMDEAWGEWEYIPESEEREVIVGKLYVNDRYHVHLNVLSGDIGPVTHLSIRANNRSVLRDWRDYQRIKNELCGENCEGMEIYPSESRLVDNADQFHLWVLPEGMRIPFGFANRLVSEQSEYGSQRPFKASQRPADLSDIAKELKSLPRRSRPLSRPASA